jgi:hypothetical protein
MPLSSPSPVADPEDARLPLILIAVVVVEALTILGLYAFGRLFS